MDFFEKECVHRWKANGLPRKGWELVDVEDTGDLTSECEWCGTSIRYVHHIVHKTQGHRSTCGCVCGENLTQDYVGHRAKEKMLRKTASMSKRWLTSPRWRQSERGNIYRRDQAVQVLLYKKGANWGIKVGEDWGTRTYPSLDQAKIAALRLLNERP